MPYGCSTTIMMNSCYTAAVLMYCNTRGKIGIGSRRYSGFGVHFWGGDHAMSYPIIRKDAYVKIREACEYLSKLAYEYYGL